MLVSTEMIQERLESLMDRDNTDPRDIERKVLFFIIAHHDKLYRDVDSIYFFEEHSIIFECLEDQRRSSGERALIRLAFNLFSGGGVKADVYSSLRSLDPKNLNLALEAIRMRFGI